MSDILVIKCNYELNSKEYDSIRKAFLYQKSTRVVLLPPGFEAIVVPNDAKIKVTNANENPESKSGSLLSDIPKTCGNCDSYEYCVMPDKDVNKTGCHYFRG